MIHPYVHFEGFDAESYARLAGVFAPSGAPRKRGTLIIVIDDDERVLGAFHTERGRIPRVSSAADPEAAAAVHGARRVLVARDGAFEELAERLAMRLRRSDDVLAQWLTLAHAVRELAAADQLRLFPSRFADVPLPTPEAIRRALDVLLPNDRTALLVLTEGPTIATAIAVRRRAGAIDRIVGPERIAEWTGPCGGDLRRDHHHFVEAVSRNLAPVHVALSAEVETLDRLLHRREPGAFAAAIAVRELIVDPAPAWTSLAVGVDVVRSLVLGLVRAFDEVDLLALLASLGGTRGGSVPPPEALLSRLLGSTPSEALGRVLDRFRGED